MNELILKRAKGIGRKWAYIYTFTLITLVVIIVEVKTGFSDVTKIFKESTFIISIFTTLILSSFVGGKTGSNMVTKINHSVWKWVVDYFFISWFFFCLPLVIEMGYNSMLDLKSLLIWITVFLFYTLIIGCIPILTFGYIYGKCLKAEITKEG